MLKAWAYFPRFASAALGSIHATIEGRRWGLALHTCAFPPIHTPFQSVAVMQPYICLPTATKMK